MTETRDAPPKDGAAQIDRLTSVFDTVERTMQKVADDIEADTLGIVNDFHDTASLVKGRNSDFRTKLANFRARLGLSTNFPPKAITDASADGGRVEDAEIVGETKPA